MNDYIDLVERRWNRVQRRRRIWNQIRYVGWPAIALGLYLIAKYQGAM